MEGFFYLYFWGAVIGCLIIRDHSAKGHVIVWLANVGWRTWIHFCLWVRLVFRLIIDDLSKEEQLIIKLMLGWARAVINDEVHD